MYPLIYLHIISLLRDKKAHKNFHFDRNQIKCIGSLGEQNYFILYFRRLGFNANLCGIMLVQYVYIYIWLFKNIVLSSLVFS